MSHFTISGIFLIRGRSVFFHSITLSTTFNGLAISARYKRKRTRLEMELSEKLVETLNMENDFSRFVWIHEEEEKKADQELAWMRQNYAHERGF